MTTLIKERLNLYVCEHGCHNITVDVDKGVTPFMIPCQFKGRPDRPANPALMKDGKCIGLAKSSMYPRELPPEVPYPVPTHEWYKPEGAEYDALQGGAKEHVDNGGLLLRERTDKLPIYHPKEKEDVQH